MTTARPHPPHNLFVVFMVRGLGDCFIFIDSKKDSKPDEIHLKIYFGSKIKFFPRDLL
jgi:hypothetical protein